MYLEDDLLPISALQHLLFCERRAALVHLEGAWNENVFTAEGRILHDRAHDLGTEVRGNVHVARGLRLRSLALGLSGKADVVEFHRLPRDKGMAGVRLPDAEGLWKPVPVEYKRGRLRREEGYEIQLCAQALCLEEMLQTTITEGAVYYGKTRRRLEVQMGEKLREAARDAITRLHALIDSRITPKASKRRKCESCSLLGVCMPAVLNKREGARRYLAKAIYSMEEDIQRTSDEAAT